jgi:DNA-binding MarR family transcriptional regulator
MGNLNKELSTNIENAHVKALINIKYTSNFLDQIANSFFQPYNISEQQYNILRILRGAGKKLNVHTVKERMFQKSPNSTRLMDKLCEKKFIERTRCESDRRVVYVKITSKGLQLLDEIKLDVLHEKMELITEEEAIVLNTILDKLRQ